MKKVLILVLLFLGLGTQQPLQAQSGGKKKEGRNFSRSARLFQKSKSPGNADKFAGGGSGRRGFFARLFKKPADSWNNRSSGTVKSHRRANRSLFTRERSKGKRNTDAILERQNKERAKRRVRGNKVFSKKKY